MFNLKIPVAATVLLALITCVSYSQNVGIGTTAPTRAVLELHGSILSTSAIFGGESSGISLQSNGPAIGFNEYAGNGARYLSNGFGAIQYLDPANGYLAFAMLPTGGKDAVATTLIPAIVISNTGNVGIRATPINATLFVTKANNPDGSAVFGGTTYNTHFHYGSGEDTYIRGGKTGSKLFLNDIGGGKIVMGNGSSYVGINNGASPAYPLEIRQVNGRGLLLVEPANSFNNWELRIARPSGWTESNLYLIYNGLNKGYFTWGTGIYENFSDRRLKTAISNMPDVLQKVMQLQTVSYQMKGEKTGTGKTVGFIAQDVSRLFPELVSITKDPGRGFQGIPDLHAINYNGFIVLTIKALQEQQTFIKELRLKNKALAHRIAVAEASVVSGE
ncbi:MAG: tail fiber domain-containing protein [Bacteroidota bacterium]